MSLKAVVIGCGRMGARPSQDMKDLIPKGWLPLSHVEALQMTKEVEVSAVCDSNSKSLALAKSNHGIKHGGLDYKQVIETHKPDIVTIATRTPEKKKIIEVCINNNVRGLYVEKPLAFSIHDCRQTLEALKSKNIAIQYGVNRRYHPAYKKAKSLIQQGAIGELREVRVEHGEAPLFWSHPHATDILLYFSQATQLRWLSCHMQQNTFIRTSEKLVDSDPVIESASIMFENDVLGSISRTAGLSTRIGGKTGVLTVSSDGTQIQLEAKGPNGYFVEKTNDFDLSGESATQSAMGELVQAINKNSILNTDHIQLGTELLLGCGWSHCNDGKRIGPSVIPQDFLISSRSGENYA